MTDYSPLSRRHLLRGAVIGGFVGIAGCSGNTQDDTSGEEPESSPAATSDGEPDSSTAEESDNRGQASAGSWPQFQSDSRNSGLTDAKELVPPVEERWRFGARPEFVNADDSTAGDFAIKAQPVVVDDTLLIGANKAEVYDPDEGREVTVPPRLYAIDSESGTERWSVELEAEIGGASVAVANETVFVSTGDPDGGVTALALSDGSEQWRKPFPSPVGPAPVTGGSPVVHDGRLYTSYEGVIALDIMSGDEVWQFEVTRNAQSHLAVGDGHVFCMDNVEGVFYAVDIADGTESWRFETDEYARSSPVVRNGTVIMGDGQEVRALDTTDGTERWRFEDGMQGAPAADGERFYIQRLGTAAVSALDPETGDEQWTYESGAGAQALAITDETLYLTGEFTDGLQAVNTSDGTERWSFSLREASDAGVFSPPAIGTDTVYFGDQHGTVHAISGQ